MSDTALKLTHAAATEFLDRNRDLLALTKEGPKRVMQRIEATLTLADDSIKNDVMMYLDTINQTGYAGQVGRADFQKAMYAALCHAFIKAQHNFVIEFATKLTPEALEELYEIERIVGVREPLPPPVPQKSAQELLIEQVKEDWQKLETSKFKTKMQRDPDYRAVAERLLAGDGLRTQATALVDGRGFDQ